MTTIRANSIFVCTLLQNGHLLKIAHHTHTKNIKLFQNPNPKITTPHKNGGYTKLLNFANIAHIPGV